MRDMKNNKKKRITYFSPINKDCVIHFSTIFNDESLLNFEYVNVNIPTKKAYGSSIDKYCKSNNMLLNKDQELAKVFMFSYMIILKNLNDNKFSKDNYIQYINTIVSSLLTEPFVKFVLYYVKQQKIEYMKIDLKKNKFPEATTFIKDHYIIFHTITLLSKLLIPLGTHYIYKYPRSVNCIRFFADLFRELFEVLKILTGINLYFKFRAYIMNSIEKSKFTDSYMWSRIRIEGFSNQNTLEMISNDLLVSLIPKFSMKMNIMSLFMISLNMVIFTHIFKRKDPYNMVSLKSEHVKSKGSGDSDNRMTDSEYMQSYNTIRHEDLLVLRNDRVMKEAVNRIAETRSIEMDPVAIKWFRHNIKPHKVQTFLMTMMFSENFLGSEYIYSLNNNRFNELVYILHIILMRRKLFCLDDYLTGINVRYDYSKFSKKLENTLTADERYMKIGEVNYKWSTYYFENRNPIKKLAIDMMNCVFKYNKYEDRSMNGKYIQNNEFKIINDVLNFFTLQ